MQRQTSKLSYVPVTFINNMSIKDNQVKCLIKAYNDFKNAKLLSMQEYLDDVREKKATSLTQTEISHFLKLTKHEQFLNKIANIFVDKYFVKGVNIHHVETVLYLVIFVLDDDNLDIFLNCFQQMKCFYLPNLLAMILDANKHLFMCQIACKYFEDDYVLDHIIYPFLNRIPALSKLSTQYEKRYPIRKKPLTVPKPFELLTKYSKKVPPPPSTTPLKPYRFRATKIPSSIYRGETAVKKRLEALHQANRARAVKLLEEASKISETLTRTTKIITVPEKTNKIFKSTPIPNFKSIDIKSNLTTTLREASRILKHQEEEVEKINNLLKGGYSKEIVERLEEEVKKEHEMKELQKIEVNHLKGLISYEEAILAKKKCLEANKEKTEKFKEDRVKLVKELDRWREMERIKIQALVEKSQSIKYSAKESEKKILEQKQQQVRLQQYETKKMLKQAFDEKMKDLEKKADLIREIKTLHQVRCSIKEFDPTETPNLGLLCEMSIAELQERLVIIKAEMSRELEEKRRSIMRKKEERHLMIENVKLLISQNKHLPKTKIEINDVSVKTEESPEIAVLKQTLEEKRKHRMGFK